MKASLKGKSKKVKGQMGTYQGEKVERRKGEKIANALALLSHIVAAASFHSFTFLPFHFYLGR